MPANDNYRIGALTAALMLFAAVILDALQILSVFLNAVPGIGVIIGFFLGFMGSFGFWLWFSLSGLDYFGGRRAVVKVITSLSAVVIELIPFLDALPFATITVGFLILTSRAEDRENAHKAQAEGRAAAENFRQRAEIAAAEPLAAPANDNEPQENARAA